MSGIKSRLRALENKLIGENREPITLIIQRIITDDPEVANDEIEPSLERGDEIFTRVVIDEKS